MEDVAALTKNLRPCSYGEVIQVAEGVAVRFTDVGHLLGSACIEIWLSEGGERRKIVFSGDVGNVNQPLLRDPQAVSGADYVVCESTYGDRLHEKVRTDYVTELARVIQRVFDRGGNVVIPSFAVGRFFPYASTSILLPDDHTAASSSASPAHRPCISPDSPR